MTPHERYNKSPKGRARWKRYAKSVKGRTSRERFQSSPQGRAIKQRWWRKERRRWLRTPAGRRFTAHNNLHLPVTAPDNLVRAIHLLRELRKELRHP